MNEVNPRMRKRVFRLPKPDPESLMLYISLLAFTLIAVVWLNGFTDPIAFFKAVM